MSELPLLSQKNGSRPEGSGPQKLIKDSRVDEALSASAADAVSSWGVSVCILGIAGGQI